MRTSTDEPVRNLLPKFASPPVTIPPEDPPATAEETPSPSRPMGLRERVAARTRRLLPDDASDSLDVPSIPRPDDEPTRTETSSGSKPSAKQTTDLFVGLVLMAAVGAAALAKWRLRAKLRQPTTGQARDIAAPLARIALRHFDASWLNADLGDLLMAGAATGAYVNDGPLLGPLHPDAGMPDNLQETHA